MFTQFLLYTIGTQLGIIIYIIIVCDFVQPIYIVSLYNTNEKH